MTWAVTTNVSGTYSCSLDAGIYTVTASYANHISKTVAVSITAQMTSTQDLELRILQPCVSVAPLSMEQTVVRGTSETQTLTLDNTGAVSATFELREAMGWLDKDPITGTLDADTGTQFVDVTFTAFPTMTSGIYAATLIASTDDPTTPTINVPVTMTIVSAPVCGFVSSSPDDLGQTTYFSNTTTGDTPMSYLWDLGDHTTSDAISPTHTYTQAGWYTVVLTANNQYGQDICSADVAIVGPPPAGWEKLVYINNVLTDAFPAVVTSGDEIGIMDRVEVYSAENVTFTLTEEWTESLELLTYTVRASPGSTAVLPYYGTVILSTTDMLVEVFDAPHDWDYVFTKTFNVLAGSWTTDTITETLWVEGSVSQLEPIVLEFEYREPGEYIYLPIVMRSY